MTERLRDLADRLSLVLEEETALLEALDLSAAGGLLARKRAAVAALQAALIAVPEPDLLRGPGTDTALRDSVRRLAALAAANRAAVARGLALQTRLIETIARAVPRARAEEAPTYRPDGGKLPTRPPQPYAFLSRM
jgi:hypothetical protein